MHLNSYILFRESVKIFFYPRQTIEFVNFRIKIEII